MLKMLGWTQMTRIISMMLMVLVFASCSKTRPVELTDEQKVNLFSKADLDGAVLSATLDSPTTTQAVRTYAPLQATDQVQKLKIVKVEGTADGRIAALLLGQWVEGAPGEVISIRLGFTVYDGASFLTAYKVVSPGAATAKLSIQETIMASSNNGDVVLFNYSITSQGILQRQKNELNEDTRRVWLVKTDLSNAQYVQVASLAENRKKVGIDALSDVDRQSMFIKSNLDGKTYPATYLKSVLKMDLKINDAAIVYTEFTEADTTGNPALDIMEVMDIKDLTPEETKILAISDQTGEIHQHVKRCSAVVAAQYKQFDKCVVVSRVALSVSYVDVKPAKDLFTGGQDWSKVNVVDVRKDNASLVKIDINQRPSFWIPNVDFYDPAKKLVVKDFVNKEFIFRRTLTDMSNMFSEVFPGLSGDLQIVKFVFTEKNLEIRRSRPLLVKTGVNDTDNELLMSFPATYEYIEKLTPEGKPQLNPVKRPTTFQNPDAIAIVDWTSNKMPATGSVLSEWGIEEECFRTRASETVDEVNFDRRSGVYGFTITQTYPASKYYCAAGLSDDWMDRYSSPIQKTFSFKERVAFREYKDKATEIPSYLNVDYETQKRLGFGLFSYNRFVPNKYGNITYDGSRVSVASVFDLRDKKSQITYVLSGIPTSNDDDDLRQVLIKTTIEGIADINKAFRMAFKGTPMERPDGAEYEVIRLQVEDMSEDEINKYSAFNVQTTTPGFVGDFDKNYIRYIQKGTKSTIIGLGGAHHNPYSGKVEAASVFIYGGNIKSYIEIIRKREESRANYRKSIGAKAVATNIITKEERDLLAAGKADLNPTGRSIFNFDKSNVSNMSTSEVSDHFAQALAIGYDPSVLAAKVSDRQNVMLAIQSLRRGSKADISSTSPVFAAGSSSPELEKANKIMRVYKQLIEESRRDGVNYLVNPRMVAARMDPQNNAAMETFSNLIRRIQAKNYCVHELDAQASTVFANGIPDDVTDTDLIAAIFKPTLVHEIGHNLGLRHNFIASFDKANWKFTPDEQTHRDYTSVMDYTPNDHETYDGMGPYDVHALRVAYAGYLELDVEKIQKPAPLAQNATETQKQQYDLLPSIDLKAGKLITKVQGAGNKVNEVVTPIIDGYGGRKLISVDAFQKAAGIGSWIGINTDALNRVGLKKFMFCSDEDAGMSPVCNRHDLGSTPEEIVDHMIKDYKELYGLRNFRNDKLYFRRWDDGPYIGGLMQSFMTSRYFLEESIYRLAFLKEDFQTQVLPYFNAALKAYYFYQEVIRTPDATEEEARSGNRFVKAKVGGQNVIVEKKALLDINHDDTNYFDLAVRGIEYDKILALIALTDRSNSSLRYNQNNLVFSYYTLESWLDEANFPANSGTLKLLTEIFKDDIKPQIPTAKGYAVLPDKFKADVNVMLQYYGAIAGTIWLDITQGADNPGDMFRVLRGFNPPASRPSIVEPGHGKDDLKFYTVSNSLVSDQLINDLYRIAPVADDKNLQKAVTDWFLSRKAVEQAGATATVPAANGGPSMADQMAAIEVALTAKLQALPAVIPNRDLPSLYKKMNDYVTVAARAQQLQNSATSKETIKDWVDGEKVKNIRNAYVDPLTTYGIAGLVGKDIGLTIIDEVKADTRTLDWNRSTRVDSLQFLSQFFYMRNSSYVGQN